MSQGGINTFSLGGPNIVQNKGRYREEEYRKKNTYNFVTDPRLKRGRNYGIVYVTSATAGLDETGPLTSSEQGTISKLKDFNKKRITKKTISSIPAVPLPSGLESVDVQTDEIKEYLPKEETKEMEVQTQDYIDRPETPIFTPVKEGEDKATQIEKGELFDFDEEVEPIVNVLTFKTLEEARMEVLEEEEIKEMKEQEMEFERIRNRELTEVQKLENREKRKKDEKERRVKEKNVRKDMAKIFQKKLMSCVFSKKSLANLKNRAIVGLEFQGFLRKPLTNEYQTNLLPFIHSQNEEIYNTESIVLNEIDTLFEDNYKQNIIEEHKKSIETERQRLEELARKKQEEKERREEERRKRREEKERIKHEKELQVLKDKIKAELFQNAEFIDDPNEIYEINGYHLKGSKAVSVIGGHFSQFCFFVFLLKNLKPEIFKTFQHALSEEEQKEEAAKKEEAKVEMTEEKREEDLIYRLLDLYLLKCKPFYIFYKNEDLEEIKQIEPNFTFEDIYKLSPDNFNKVVEILIQKHFENDELMEDIFTKFTDTTKVEGIKEFMTDMFKKMFDIVKATVDFDPKEKLKFISKEKAEIDSKYYFGVCSINSEIIKKPEQKIDITAQLMAKKLKKNDKMNRPFFEPYMIEKSFVFTFANDNMRVLVFNDNFERILRWNLFECICKLEKRFEEEKEKIFTELSNIYTEFSKELKNEVLKKYEKEMLDMEVKSFDFIPPEQK